MRYCLHNCFCRSVNSNGKLLYCVVVYDCNDVKGGDKMRFVSWNVNGLRACVGKGFMEYFKQIDADIFCVQETKLQEGQIELDTPGYHQYWNYAKKKGYSGTAIFTKEEPISVQYGIGIEEHDQEGRVITLEFEDFYFTTVYTPNSQNELARLDYRMKWEDDFLAFQKKLEKKKPVIFCGDLNVAHKEIDLKNPKTNRKNAGFTDEKEESLPSFWNRDLLIPSDIFIRSRRESIPGGPIVLRQEKKMQDGVLTILLPQRGLKSVWWMLKLIPKFWDPIIVRLF